MVTWTEELIQLALTNHSNAKFYCRRWYCVPNVTDYGMPGVISNQREVDLLCVSQSMWAHAVEVKCSKSDLAADMRKHWRKLESRFGPSNQIQYEWFAVPEELADDAIAMAPAEAGVIAISENIGSLYLWSINRVVREAKKNRGARKLTEKELLQLLRLGVMRMWSKRKAVYE